MVNKAVCSREDLWRRVECRIMPEDPTSAPQSSIILYQTEDGRTRIQCRFEAETIWLTQKLMAQRVNCRRRQLSGDSG